MRKATFRILRYETTSGNRYSGLAWNYSEAVLLGTPDFATYTEARAALEAMCAVCGVFLQWFDGSYKVVGELIEPDSDAHQV